MVFDERSGKIGWLGQFIWLFGWMVSVVKLVKRLGCWNQVVRMIYHSDLYFRNLDP